MKKHGKSNTMWLSKYTKERIKTMFDKIITNKEVKFNDLEKKIFKFVCFFGCLIIKLLLEKYDRKLMNSRDLQEAKF